MTRRTLLALSLVAFSVMSCSTYNAMTDPKKPAAAPADKPALPATNTELPPGEVIGRWGESSIANHPINGIDIFRKDGKLFARHHFVASAGFDEETEETVHLGMRKFSPKGGRDYFLIDASGSLQSWDRDGYVETRARK